MATDPMTLAQLRLAAAVMDSFDGMLPGQAMVIRKTANGGVEAGTAVTVEAAIRQVREIEARDRKGVER
jgi:hypothetical protein